MRVELEGWFAVYVRKGVCKGSGESVVQLGTYDEKIVVWL